MAKDPGTPTKDPQPAAPDNLAAAIEEVRGDIDFTEAARRLIERDREIIDRLGR